jgi:hypothetical protein
MLLKLKIKINMSDEEVKNLLLNNKTKYQMVETEF